MSNTSKFKVRLDEGRQEREQKQEQEQVIEGEKAEGHLLAKIF